MHLVAQGRRTPTWDTSEPPRLPHEAVRDRPGIHLRGWQLCSAMLSPRVRHVVSGCGAHAPQLQLGWSALRPARSKTRSSASACCTATDSMPGAPSLGPQLHAGLEVLCKTAAETSEPTLATNTARRRGRASDLAAKSANELLRPSAPELPAARRVL